MNKTNTTKLWEVVADDQSLGCFSSKKAAVRFMRDLPADGRTMFICPR